MGGEFLPGGEFYLEAKPGGEQVWDWVGAYPGPPASLWQSRPESGVLSPSLVIQAPESLEERRFW